MTTETVTAATTSGGQRGPEDQLSCPTCGHRPAARRELIPHLDTLWLHVDDAGQVTEQRHCARCQPHEQVASVCCERCGDGPLVTGAGGEVPDAVLRWLEDHGWTTAADLLCDRHT